MTRAFAWCLCACSSTFATLLIGCHEPHGTVELVHGQVLTAQIALTPPDKTVDILFVIDDSSSMAAVQANLAANFHSFVDVLEAPDVEASYRIGVTTTDGGNPRCPGAVAERGALVMQPCTQRLDDFVRGDVDVGAVACTDICTLSEAELEILPTTTAYDSTAKPRPWLESILGQTNLPDGVDVADAFACYGPQGIAGCDFESPLESMYLAFDRFLDSQDPAYGFLRHDAITMIIFVTDGHDCSHPEAWAEIFEPEGNRVFWSDPNAEVPTSAVCWNAGIDCVGDPGHYDSCDAVDKDVEGELADSEDRAVLHPVERYVERLQAHEDVQKQLDPDREVIVSLLGGVANDGDPFHADADEPEFQDAYGIGPGCTSNNGIAAVPPVRLYEFTEAFVPDNAFSICNSDYTPALNAIADKLIDHSRPACFPGCIADTDLHTQVSDPDCYVQQRRPEGELEWIEECKRSVYGDYSIDPSTMDYSMPADDVDVCYAMLVDNGGHTYDYADDMSPECVDEHVNVEFKISRRPGFPVPGGTAIYATCLLSDFPQVDCPGLGT